MNFSKKMFFKTMARACPDEVKGLAEQFVDKAEYKIVKKPQKVLVMLPMREPVHNSIFFLGEMLACQAVVEKNGVYGYAVTKGDNFEKTLCIAMLDAALNLKNNIAEKIKTAVFELYGRQKEEREKENGRIARTAVNFNTMGDK